MIWKITSAGSATSPKPKSWSEARETTRQLRRFLVVGGTSVLVDLLVYRVLSAALGWRLDVAKGISYWCGVAVGFVGNKWWTFRSSRRSLAEPLSYLALYSLTMVVNIACNRAVLDLLGSTATVAAFLFATGVTTILNFLGMRLFTFRRGIEARQQGALGRSEEAVCR